MAKNEDESGLDEFAGDREPMSLGDAAGAALTGEDGQQGEFDETDFLKVKFVGMAFDSLDKSIKIGDEMTFTVRGRCVGTGEEAMRTGGIRHFAKMDVQSVIVAVPETAGG